jgi:pimeloyl-ACP methyl ester carboxylesterase
MGGVLAPGEMIDRWERLVASGESDRMVREFLRDVGGYEDAEIDALAATPMWEARKRVAPSVPRELRAELAHRLEPETLAGVDAQALMLVGSESPPWAIRSTEAYADALPRAETHVLEGHGHGANVTAPELVAAEIERFLLGEREVSSRS